MLLSVARPAWLTQAANGMVVVHVMASWQVRCCSGCKPAGKVQGAASCSPGCGAGIGQHTAELACLMWDALAAPADACTMG